MTCVVGVVGADGLVRVGADSVGVSGEIAVTRADAKVFAVGPLVVGCTHSFRMMQLLRYRLVLPPLPVLGRTERALGHPALVRWMVCEFADAVRAAFAVGGWLETKNGREESGQFLVGVAGRLFEIEADMQVGELLVPHWNVIGTGEQIAKGAMEVLQTVPGITDEERIRRALAAAERHVTSVRGPWVLVRTDDTLLPAAPTAE